MLLIYPGLSGMGWLALSIRWHSMPFWLGQCRRISPRPWSLRRLDAVVGAIINYILNAKFTFNRTGHAQALPRFALIAIAGALINGVLMKILIYAAGLNYMIAQVLATFIVLALTYSMNSIWTFRSAAASPGLDNTSIRTEV